MLTTISNCKQCALTTWINTKQEFIKSDMYNIYITRYLLMYIFDDTLQQFLFNICYMYNKHSLNCLEFIKLSNFMCSYMTNP